MSAGRRSRDGNQWTRLPPYGLTGDLDVPQWPIELGKPSAEELALWTRLWRTKPAAWAWLEHDQGDAVAIYVRMWLNLGTSPYANQVAETRRQGELLLLTMQSMERSRYTVDKSVTGPVNGLDAPKDDEPRASGQTVVSARDRFRKQ